MPHRPSGKTERAFFLCEFFIDSPFLPTPPPPPPSPNLWWYEKYVEWGNGGCEGEGREEEDGDPLAQRERESRLGASGFTGTRYWLLPSFFFFAWLARTELATAFWWFCRDGNCLCVCVCTCVCVWRWVLAGRTRRSEDSVVRLYWVNPGSERNRNEQPRGTAVGNVSHFQ